ncbi:MAG: 5-oxoprolinase subunit PxpB [Janthinobacterium lividum]
MSGPASPRPAPRIRVAGTGGLVVEFGSVVDAGLNRLVMALDAQFGATVRPGVVETVPTYRSLLVIFDPLVADRRALADELATLAAGLRVDDEPPARVWTVPVAYGGAFGEDLESVAARHGLDPDEVVRIHAGAEYRVFMIGFAPGFAYLGGLPDVLQTPRRLDPRPRIPAGSITVGGLQAAVTSIEAPSGWHLLGRTPLRTFDLRRPDPFLFRPGDRVRFRRISGAEFARLSVLAEGGTVTADVEDVA